MSRATIGRVTDLLPFPPELLAPGAGDAPFRAALPLADLPPGALRRVTFGDLDVLLAHTDRGPRRRGRPLPAHVRRRSRSASLDGCVVACPLHGGRFDLASGDPVQMPTTGGLRPDGTLRAGLDARRAASPRRIRPAPRPRRAA